MSRVHHDLEGHMPEIDSLLGELSGSVTHPLHKRLVEAYRSGQDLQALLAECNKYMQEKIDAIEGADNSGNTGIQRPTDD